MTVDTGEFRALSDKVDRVGELLDGHTALLIRCLAAAVDEAGKSSPAGGDIYQSDLPPRKRHLHLVKSC